ncbi:MAG: glycerophosphodiester phosphodiesterase [Promethearchaeota archaeon]
MYRILISGHRGFRSKEIDNTANAFERAIKMGLDYIEFDVRRTKDQVPVIFHNLKIDKLLNGKGTIHKIALKDLKTYQYKDGQRIQTLREMFEQCAGKINLMLEIKSTKIEDKIINLVKEFNLEESIIIQSFNRHIIKRCYELYPSSDIKWCFCIGPIGMATKATSSINIQRLDKSISNFLYRNFIKPYPYVTYLNIDAPITSKSFIENAVKDGKNLILGANRPEDYLDNLKEWNVRIINCDDPERIVKMICNKYSNIYKLSDKLLEICKKK